MSNTWIQRITVLLQMGIAAAILGGVVPPKTSQAQEPLTNVAELRIDDSVATLGVEAAKRGDYGSSIELLLPLFQQEAGYVVSDHDAIGYWLGESLLQAHTARNALHIWHRTLRSLDEESAAWSRIANAFVRATFETNTLDYQGVAAQTYLTLIERAGRTSTFPEPIREAVRQHVLETAFVLPDDIKRRIGLDPSRPIHHRSELTLNESAGEILAAWWRKQDRSVASASNERLVEHLSRVADTRASYMHDGYIDARGRVHIRLGPPPITLEVTFADYPIIQREIIRRQTNVTSFDFSPGIYWEYDDLGTEAHFLFLESDEGDAYELGTVTDMIPRHIRRNFTGRSTNTYAYLRSMEVALRQLSVYNPRYMGRYAEVENYLAYYNTGGGINFATPGEQATKVNQRNTMEDHRLKRIRRETVGTAQSNVDASYPDLDVQTRWARFLEDDGTTRTEIYWTAPSDLLDPRTAINADALDVEDMEIDAESIPGASRIIASTRLEDSEHRTALQANRQARVPESVESNWLPAQTLAIRSDKTPFHLGVQWDQRLGEDAESAGNLLLRRSTARIDTLAQLSNDASSIEMSDVKLVEADPDALAEGMDGRALPPYPREDVHEDTPLGIYFEVYHLMFDENDRSRYTVDLNVDRVQPRGGVARWVRGDEELQTTTTTTNETTQRRTNELFLLDVAAWEDAAENENVTLTVRITDEVSGASVERNVTLTVVRDGE